LAPRIVAWTNELAVSVPAAADSVAAPKKIRKREGEITFMT